MDPRDSRVAAVVALIGVVCMASSAAAQPAPSSPPSSGSQLPSGALPPLPPAAPVGGAPQYGNPAMSPPPGYAAPVAPYGAPPATSAAPAAPLTATEPPRAAPMPIELRYVEGRPIPPGYHPETRVRRGLVITGAILFGVPYVFSMSSAASSTFQPDRWLYVPVLGPFIDLAQRGDRCSRSGPFPNGTGITITNESCTDDAAARWFVMFDGLMQTAGATMLILGLALPHHLLVRDDAPYSANGTTFGWTVRPQPIGRAGYGVGVDGTF